ncbi:MAG TPA: DUF1800 domain-containing protein [Mycobacteriales bacterium]|nr:DUF1800 domain-containing protein [Mycobacteriales bacterium]
MSDATRAELAHLLRRGAFAPSVAELDHAERLGYDRVVDLLLSTPPDPAATPMPTLPPPPPAARSDRAAAQARRLVLREQTRQLQGWWLDRMTGTQDPALERRTFFWHGHFATSVQKVQVAGYMAGQNQTFRQQGLAAFDALTLSVAQGPAMLVWLDAADNVAAHPNENLGRELMELFTLGVGNYTETDVREAARCLTGWSLDRRSGAFSVRAARHDAGRKTVLGVTGALDGADLVHLVTQRPQSARWVTARIWQRHVAPVSVGDPTVHAVADAAARTPAGAVLLADVWRRILLSATFRDPAVRGQLVAQPVEWAVGAMRQLAVRAREHGALLDRALLALGQVPFAPPSVGGWPAGRAWLSTSAVLARAAFAQQLAAAADLAAVADQAPTSRVDATAHLLAISAWSPASRSALDAVRADPVRLMALALCSPEYVTR